MALKCMDGRPGAKHYLPPINKTSTTTHDQHKAIHDGPTKDVDRNADGAVVAVKCGE